MVDGGVIKDGSAAAHLRFSPYLWRKLGYRFHSIVVVEEAGERSEPTLELSGVYVDIGEERPHRVALVVGKIEDTFEFITLRAHELNYPSVGGILKIPCAEIGIRQDPHQAVHCCPSIS